MAEAMPDAEDVPPPDGFQRHFRQSPLTEPWEPLFSRVEDEAVVIGVRVRRAHCNAKGILHGGFISALADNAMGLSCAHQLGGQNRIVTASLSVDFLGSATIGQWIEFRTTFTKTGRTLCFAQAFVTADGQPCARANAVFHVSPIRDAGAEAAKV